MIPLKKPEVDRQMRSSRRQKNPKREGAMKAKKTSRPVRVCPIPDN